MNGKKLTIGQLAKRVGLRTSALRYYEEQELLFPVDRTDSGYRLYDLEAEQTLHFIQKAQKLGFSLADIRTMLTGVERDTLSDRQILEIAEERFLDLERRLTELLVVRHEMASFVSELESKLLRRTEESSGSFFDRMVGQVCAGPIGRIRARSILDWLIELTGCTLRVSESQHLLDVLRGQHVHIWQQGDGYQILIVSRDADVKEALWTLAQLEANCHAHPMPRLEDHKEGYLLSANGRDAFVFARLFLALEQESS